MIGGIEVSSVAFINNLYKDIDLDVFAFSKTGKLLSELPDGLRIYQGNKFAHWLYCDRQSHGIEQNLSKKFRFKVFIKTLLRKLGFKELLKKLCFVGQNKFRNYDIAICFDGMDPRCVKMALSKVQSKAKICFIHCDTNVVIPTKAILKNLKKFDKIYCVSESCAESLKAYFTDDNRNKVDYLYNFQNVEKIKSKASEFDVKFDTKRINIVSVSRLSPEKAHIRSLNVFKNLNKRGYENFVWHILGEGQCFEQIQQFVANNHMEEYIKLYGNQSNPYPYIKNSDYFYLGSYHEAAPMVYAEAKILGKTILSTETRSSKELIGNYGIICQNDEGGIYGMFEKVFKDGKESVKNNKYFNYDNDAIKSKLLKEFEMLSK